MTVKCDNDFICVVCDGIFPRDIPIEQAMADHEARKLEHSGYDCGGQPVEVCENCYGVIMKNFLHTFDA